MVYSLLYSTTDFSSEAAPSESVTRVLGRFSVVIFPWLPATLHSVCSPLARVRDGSLPLQLRLSDSNQAWLTPATTSKRYIQMLTS